jgi:hypothetical protein
MAIVSGYRSDFYDKLYSGWSRVDKAAGGAFGKSHVESLWISPRASSPPPSPERGNRLF